METIDCGWARDHIAAFLDRELAGDELARLRRHLEGCAPCRAELEAHRASWELFRGVSAPQPVPERLLRNPYERRRLLPAWLLPAAVSFAAATVAAILVLPRLVPPAVTPEAGLSETLTLPLPERSGSGLEPAPLPLKPGGSSEPRPTLGAESELTAAPRLGAGGSGLRPTPVFSSAGSGLPCAPFKPAEHSSLGPVEDYLAQQMRMEWRQV